MFGNEAIEYMIKAFSFDTVLDVGCGRGDHSTVFRASGKTVTGIDIKASGDCIKGDYMTTDLGQFDAVWVCHVLEHQLNVNQFLRKIHEDLKEGGVLAITVPPMKHSIVGGHVTVWNAGLLLYNLILAGFNCRDARIKKYGYNISVIIEKQTIKLPELCCDCGDINTLGKFFPAGLKERFNGDILELNWDRSLDGIYNKMA